MEVIGLFIMAEDHGTHVCWRYAWGALNIDGFFEGPIFLLRVDIISFLAFHSFDKNISTILKGIWFEVWVKVWGEIFFFLIFFHHGDQKEAIILYRGYMCFTACTVCINISKCMYFLHIICKCALWDLGGGRWQYVVMPFCPFTWVHPSDGMQHIWFALDSSWRKLILSQKQFILAYMTQ